MAIRQVVEMIEGLDNDYNDDEGYFISVATDPLDDSILTATIQWGDDRDDEEYEIKIARVV